MDRKELEAIEKYQKHLINDKDDLSDSSQDEEELLDLLNDDDVLSKYREDRLEQLKKEFAKINRNAEEGGGKIRYMDNEEEVMKVVSRSDAALVHFYQPEFVKCRVMNAKLEIARNHLELTVISIKAEMASFLVTKLNVKVLPFVVMYLKGQEVDRLVGFSKLGNQPEDFNKDILENMLYSKGMLNRPLNVTFQSGRINRSRRTNGVSDDDDDDDDLDIL